jgi:hypothetical protein
VDWEIFKGSVNSGFLSDFEFRYLQATRPGLYSLWLIEIQFECGPPQDHAAPGFLPKRKHSKAFFFSRIDFTVA